LLYDLKNWKIEVRGWAKAPFHCSCIVFLNTATVNAASNLRPDVPVLSCSVLNVMKMQIKKRRVKCIPRPYRIRRPVRLMLVSVEVAAETAGGRDGTIPTDRTLSQRPADGAAVVTDAEGVGADADKGTIF
jgi:hypothetical protein